MSYLQIGPYNNLLTHFRYLLTLRSEQGKYHSLILFRLADSGGSLEDRLEKLDVLDEPGDGVLIDHKYKQLYLMESACPHLGADMSHADIEECEDSVVAVCPWHRYDFDLRTGSSDSGLKACTYSVQVRKDEGKVDNVWIQTPGDGTGWRCVELRPVSEAFADPPPPIAPAPAPTQRVHEDVVPPDNVPTTLMEWGVLILNTANPTLKVERTRHAVHLFRTGQLKSIGHRSPNAPTPPDEPPREALETQDQRQLKGRRNLAGMLHSLANVEQWAIDLAWDIMVRFGPQHPDLPPAFFSDFTKMALDESKHFSLLCSRLSATSPSTPYGTMPVHAALWESAVITKTLRSRLAIVHMKREVSTSTPKTIERFRGAGDKLSVSALSIIHADEVTHVTAGHRWFTWICAQQGLDPVEAFRDEVKKGWRGVLPGPFNEVDRERAGMTKDYYLDLVGEMGWEEREMREREEKERERVKGAKVEIGYT